MKCAAMDMVRAFCLLAVFGLCIPAATAVSAGGVQTAALNVTNVSVTDAAFPADYRLTPTPVFLGFSTNGPLSGAPKGEMGAVPRRIGIQVSTAVLITGIAAIAGAAALYLVNCLRRKPGKE